MNRKKGQFLSNLNKILTYFLFESLLIYLWFIHFSINLQQIQLIGILFFWMNYIFYLTSIGKLTKKYLISKINLGLVLFTIVLLLRVYILSPKFVLAADSGYCPGNTGWTDTCPGHTVSGSYCYYNYRDICYTEHSGDICSGSPADNGYCSYNSKTICHCSNCADHCVSEEDGTTYCYYNAGCTDSGPTANSCLIPTDYCSDDNSKVLGKDCTSSGCQEVVRENCNDYDGWVGGGNNAGCGDDPSSQYKDYYCEKPSDTEDAYCTYSVTQTKDCDSNDVCSDVCHDNKIYTYIDYYVQSNTGTCTYELGSLVKDCTSSYSVSGTTCYYNGYCNDGDSSCSYSSSCTCACSNCADHCVSGSTCYYTGDGTACSSSGCKSYSSGTCKCSNCASYCRSGGYCWYNAGCGSNGPYQTQGDYCPSTKYSGGVCYYNAYCDSSGGCHYSSSNSKPNTPSSVSKSPSCAGPSTSVTVSATISDPNGDNVKLQVCKDSSCSTILCTSGSVSSGNTASCSFTASDACSSTGTCTVYVRAIEASADPCGYTKASGTTSTSFNYDNSAPNTPTGLSPSSGTCTSDTTPTLSWSAPSDNGRQSNLQIQQALVGHLLLYLLVLIHGV